MPTLQQYTETDALFATRRALVQALILVPMVLQVLIASAMFESLTTMDRCAIIVSVLIAGVGLAMSSSDAGLWLLSLTYLPLLSLPVFEPDVGPARFATTTHAAYTALILVLLLPRVIGVIPPILTAVYLAWTWTFEPENIFPGGLQVAGGWIQVTQTFGISFTMWVFWHLLRRIVSERDERSRDRLDATERAELVRQRSILWRQTAVGLHESLLNSIRYVMRADAIDGSRLRTQLLTEQEAPELEPMSEASLRQVIEALLLDAKTWGITARVEDVPSVRLSVAVYEALRAAVGELVRNAVVHGGATEFEGSFSVSRDRLTLTVHSNQQPVPSERSTPGLGTSLVLGSLLPDAGGSWRQHLDGTGFDIEVPIESVRRRQPFSAFDKGRLLISAPLAGTTVAGTGYFWMLLAENRFQALAGLLGIVGVVMLCRQILFQHRPEALSGLLMMLIPASVPWLVQQDANFCEDISLIAPAINIAGFTVVALSMWATQWTGVIALWTWGFGGLAMLPAAEGVCANVLSLPLSNVLFIVPIISYATYRAVRAFERSRLTADRIRDDEMRARAQAAVANEIDRSLQAELTQARSVLFDLAAGEEFTTERRHELALLDARIRAALQVRADEAGILVRTAAFMIEQATANGIVVRVRSLSDSHDMRPVPLPLYQVLLKAMLGSADVEPAVQVFTDGVQEFLTVQGSIAGCAAAEVQLGSTMQFDDFTMHVDEPEPGSNEVTMVISRALLATPAVP